MMYLYVGSIVAIMCIYITVLLDNCPSGSGAGKDGPRGSSRSLRPLVGLFKYKLRFIGVSKASLYPHF